MDAENPRPQSPAPLGRALFIVALALAAGLGTVHWLESGGRETWSGYVQAQTTPAVAPARVRVGEIVAAEGELIERGEVLAVLIDEDLERETAAQQAVVSDLQNRLDEARARAEVERAWRTKELDSELHTARLDSARFLQAQFDNRVQVQAWQDYLSGGLIAGRLAHHEFIGRLLKDSRLTEEGRLRGLLEEEAARNALEVATTQLQLCDQRLVELDKLKQQLPGSIARAAGVDRLELELAEASEKLNELQARSAEIPLRAPEYGKVGVYRKQAGDRVATGQMIVEILDQERRCVAVQVPSRELSIVAAGAAVELEFPGGEARAGVVEAIAPQAMVTREDDALVTLRINPTEKLWPEVPAGSAVEVTVRR